MTDSDSLQPESGHVIYFQWSPDPGYKGEVTFISLVMRGSNVFWEEATGIRVMVTDEHLTGTENDQADEEDNENTTRASPSVTDSTSFIEEDESFILNGTSFSPEYFEPYERLEAEHGGWAKARNLAIEVDADRTSIIVFMFLFTLLS